MINVLQKSFNKIVPLLVVISFSGALHAKEVVLARNGKAQLPIVVSENSDEKLNKLASEFGSFLEKISGASFEKKTGRAEHAIFMGVISDFPEILPEQEKTSPSWRERYRVVTKDGSLYLVGETPLAVQDAMFDLLAVFGYRQFFPDKAWEIIPNLPTLKIEVDRTEEPGYATRYLFYGNITDKRLRHIFQVNRKYSEFEQWMRKNRGVSGIVVQSYHNWHRIAQRHPEAFAEHPEWISGKQTEKWEEASSKDWKFRVENEDLQKLLHQDIRTWFEQNPDMASYSIDPTDASGWPSDSPIGTPSDQMVYLANNLIDSIKDTFPDRKVAFYAYNQHSPPPSLELKRNAIVNVATGFIRGGYTVEQLLRGWREKGAELGIREYINVFFGSWDLPGGSYVGFSPEEAQSTIRSFYNEGARYWIAELDIAWGAIGLGTYVSLQTQWDPVHGPSVEELKEDFLTRSFGNAAEIMREYFDLVDSKNKPLLSSDLIGKMYDVLLKALDSEKDEKVKTRVLQFMVYTRFTELMYGFRNAPDEDNQRLNAYRDLIKWTARTRGASMFSGTGIVVRIGEKEDELTPISDEALANPEPAMSDSELIALARERSKALLRMTFKPKSYSNDLVRLDNQASNPASQVYELSRRQVLLWLAEKADSELELSIRGMGGRPVSSPAIAVKITHVNDPLDASADSAEVVPDKEWHTIRLKANLVGLYKVEILDPSNYLEIKWQDGTPVVFPSGQFEHAMPRTKEVPYAGWIYVPAGTEQIAGYSESLKGRLLDEKGQVVHDFSTVKKANYFDVKIKSQPQARVFKLEGMSGKILLMTVPPYIARSPNELLIPKEISHTN